MNEDKFIASGALSLNISHAAGRNQFSKSSREILFLDSSHNFSLIEDSLIMASCLGIRVDVWELRCRFNKGNYWLRVQTGELHCAIKSHPADPKYNLGPGGQSQELYISDPITNKQVARAHRLLKADLTLGGGKKPDPKELVDNGIYYHLHKVTGPDGAKKQDPSLRYPEGIIRWCYKKWRKVKCWVVGR